MISRMLLPLHMQPSEGFAMRPAGILAIDKLSECLVDNAITALITKAGRLPEAFRPSSNNISNPKHCLI